MSPMGEETITRNQVAKTMHHINREANTGKFLIAGSPGIWDGSCGMDGSSESTLRSIAIASTKSWKDSSDIAMWLAKSAAASSNDCWLWPDRYGPWPQLFMMVDKRIVCCRPALRMAQRTLFHDAWVDSGQIHTRRLAPSTTSWDSAYAILKGRHSSSAA